MNEKAANHIKKLQRIAANCHKEVMYWQSFFDGAVTRVAMDNAAKWQERAAAAYRDIAHWQTQL